jgi:hypothetical protein
MDKTYLILGVFPEFSEVSMSVLRNILMVSLLVGSPVAMAHFDVYWQSHDYRHDNGIRYNTGKESDKQCVRSRYGKPYGSWPCEGVQRNIPGSSYYYRRNYSGLLDESDYQGFERGLSRLRDKK